MHFVRLRGKKKIIVVMAKPLSQVTVFLFQYSTCSVDLSRSLSRHIF